jgi:hypothetical protein
MPFEQEKTRLGVFTTCITQQIADALVPPNVFWFSRFPYTRLWIWRASSLLAILKRLP